MRRRCGGGVLGHEMAMVRGDELLIAGCDSETDGGG